MRWLRDVPVWVWFIFSVVLCYTLWNPSEYSLWDFWRYGNAMTSTKALVAVVILIIALFYIHETWHSLRPIGLTLFVLLLATVCWFFWDQGILTRDNMGTSRWWGQLVIALLLTLGVQGAKIYRNLTGRVPVSPDAPMDHHGHDGGLGHHS